MHRYEAADGSVYVGSWAADEKCGLGAKHYRNGDVYEGLWRDGLPEGPGMYRWTDGSEYNGEWVRRFPCSAPSPREG
jgi:1-phosphatidylinositol-4-phosphate 5-kinase